METQQLYTVKVGIKDYDPEIVENAVDCGVSVDDCFFAIGLANGARRLYAIGLVEWVEVDPMPSEPGKSA